LSIISIISIDDRIFLSVYIVEAIDRPILQFLSIPTGEYIRIEAENDAVSYLKTVKASIV
jgi:hypothetical protein